MLKNNIFLMCLFLFIACSMLITWHLHADRCKIKIFVYDENSNPVQGASVSLRVVWAKGKTKYYDCHTDETGELSLGILGDAISIVAKVKNTNYYTSGYVFDIPDKNNKQADHLIAKIELRSIKMPARIRNQALELQFSENHKIEKINFLANSSLEFSVMDESWVACEINKCSNTSNSVVLTLRGNNVGFSKIDWPAKNQYSEFQGPYQAPEFGYAETTTIELHDMGLSENEGKRVFESNSSYYAVRIAPSKTHNADPQKALYCMIKPSIVYSVCGGVGTLRLQYVINTEHGLSVEPETQP